MIPTLLAELTRLEEGATKGPWTNGEATIRSIQSVWDVIGPDKMTMCEFGLKSDAKFVAELRNAFPLLRDELLRLRGENEKMREALFRIDSDEINGRSIFWCKGIAKQALTLTSPDGTVEVGEKK